jgi:hydroxymethylpyrimidine pyrophosphatase-like HAD family hydrolase
MGCGRITFQVGGVSKGSGVRYVLDRLGIAAHECMVFGDWLNDLSMFELGGINVAMANAVPELLERAHHITEWDCETDGIARFLETWVL